MTSATREFHIAVIALIAFFALAFASVGSAKPDHVELKPLPPVRTAKPVTNKQAADAVLYLFAEGK